MKRYLALAACSLVFCAANPTAAGADSNKMTMIPSAVHWSERECIGADVPFSSWIDPQVQPWAVLLCIHGLSLHGSNYEAFGKRMAAQGVPTYAIDVRGFGSWQNTKQAQRVDFKAALSDIHSAIESLRDAHPDVPIILLGESMGGALALQAGAENQQLIDGLICSVPAYKRSGQAKTSAKVALGLLVSPNKQMNAGPAVVHRATENQRLIDAWMEQDAMARMQLSSKELLDFARFTSHNPAAAAHTREIPVLFVQGAKDKLIKPTGTVQLFQKLATDRKALFMVNSEHLIFEHQQFDDQVVEHVTAWIRANAVATFAKRERQEDSGTTQDNLVKAEGHLKVAQGMLLLGDDDGSEDHLLQAIHLSKGSHIARQAEYLLCMLPDKDLIPNATAISAADLTQVTHQQALDSHKPSVVLFFADWVVGCRQAQEAISESLAKYGKNVNFVVVNADSPEHQPIIERYRIRPIPTILYLTADNKISGYTFGYPGRNAIDAKVRALVRTEAHSP